MFFIPSAITLTVELRVVGISFGELIWLRREYVDSLPVVGRLDSLEDADGVCAPDGFTGDTDRCGWDSALV